MTDPGAPAAATPLTGAARLTGGRLLARNTLWSLLGQGLPMVAALVAIPALVRGLGTERFGVLTLAWTVIGYFSLVDLGLGRALTQSVAERLGGDRHEELPAVVWTSMMLMLALSVIGAVLLAIAAPFLVRRVLHIPPGLEVETLRSLELLAITLPAVLATAGLGGVLAAHQRFGVLNALRIPLSVLSFLGPLAVLPRSSNLVHVIGVIVIVRYVGTLAHLVAAWRVMPELRRAAAWDPRLAGPLLRSGGWITVINVVAPLMSSLDRFLVGAWISLAAVAYYATPQEIAFRLWALPGPLAGVLFPAFAASYRVDPARLRLIFTRGLKVIWVGLFPAALAIVVLAGDGLRIWLGPAFEQHSRLVLQVLAIGAFVTGLSYVPSALLQAVGLPRRAALLYLAELPIYVLLMAVLVRGWGVPGAAFAWLARAVIDLAGLMVLAGPAVGGSAGLGRGTAAAAATVAAVAAAFAIQPLGLAVRVGFLVATLLGFGLWAWSRGLAVERRALVTRAAPR